MTMTTIIILGVVFLVVLGIFAGVWYMVVGTGSSRGGDRIGGAVIIRKRPEAKLRVPKDKDGRTDFRKLAAQRVFKPLAGVLTVAGGSQSQLREMLVHAGLRQKEALELFLGAKVALAIAIPAAVVAFTTWYTGRSGVVDVQKLIMFGTGGFAVGLLAPNFWLRSKGKGRKERIRLSLPDALDLLVVCIESGLGLDASLLRIGKELETTAPEISEEITLLTLEVSTGNDIKISFGNTHLTITQSTILVD